MNDYQVLLGAISSLDRARNPVSGLVKPRLERTVKSALQLLEVVGQWKSICCTSSFRLTLFVLFGRALQLSELPALIAALTVSVNVAIVNFHRSDSLCSPNQKLFVEHLDE